MLSGNERARRWRERHPERSKEVSNNWKKRNPEKNKAITKLWKSNNKEYLREYERIYKDENPDIIKRRDSKYYASHKKEHYLKHKEWRKSNPEKFHEDARKQLYRRRRELGYIPLNSYFSGCEGHHVSKYHVIYIPKTTHRLYPHNHKLPNTMKAINNKAFMYLINEMIS